MTGCIKACTNQNCEADPVRRCAWVGLTSEELEVLVVLGRVSHRMSLRCLSCLSEYSSHNA
ncbi:hypothetical protein RHMOL_Rhmol02G0164600 [Rhododendron molle]|uniref:Uncharacterized protein n=1 Tax=Rhododendron molle TaxID=49168 RepID=A0ACC0PT91_RHOML|nr:hypothetical protein RHMOL_Rhmol02G0164600 [Rhododendron molle]